MSDSSLDGTAEGFRRFGRDECATLPLYRHLCDAVADDASMLELLAEAPDGQQRPVLLFASIHFLLLAKYPSHELGSWYPTLAGDDAATVGTGEDDPSAALVSFVTEHREQIAELLRTRTIQTNEVNRSCAWYSAFRHIADPDGRPMFMIEMGASAGLNLRWDDYRYEFADRSGSDALFGETHSQVSLRCELRGDAGPSLDTAGPDIAGRVGIDLDPVSVFGDDVEWLRACIWPEQPLRHARFAAAVEHSRSAPALTILEGDALDRLGDAIALAPADSHIVVFHSWVLTYIERTRRVELAQMLEQSSEGRRVSWLTAEAPGCVPGLDPPADGSPLDHGTGSTILGHSLFLDRIRHDEVLARCQPHLAWMEWLAAPM